MCGIAGLFDPAGSERAETRHHQVAAMTATLTHRGPDAGGQWSDSETGVFLGHRRLSIVGLGPAGAQPMTSAGGRWVLSYNGELYNTAALRGRLEAGGVRFRGSSDTEVVVEAVQAWGLLPALEATEGMYALALWDRSERRLHLVRDRFGEKPLYHGWVGGAVAFASELKAFAALPSFRPEVDRDAVALFLRHNCIPAPHSIYRGVAKVEPGRGGDLLGARSRGRTPPARPLLVGADGCGGGPEPPALRPDRRAL